MGVTMKIISVQDTKAEAFLQPICVRTIPEALRLFEQQTKDPNSQFSKTPEDFILHHIGDYNELTGEITPCSPHAVATAAQFQH